MTKPTRPGPKSKREKLFTLNDRENWLKNHPLQWSTVIATRAALRMLPVCRLNADLEDFLSLFRATAIARFSAKHPNSAIDRAFVHYALDAAASASWDDGAAEAAAAAARAAAEVATARASGAGAAPAHDYALTALSTALQAASVAQIAAEFLDSVNEDITQLESGIRWEKLVDTPLWHRSQPPVIGDRLQLWFNKLRDDGDHWSIWTTWYNAVLKGKRSTEIEDARFTDIKAELPWKVGRVAVSAEITRRIGEIQPDLNPIEGIISPITIIRRPDGRIGVEPGPFSLPTLPSPSSSADHRGALAACRNRATQLANMASSPNFQGRSEYAQIIGEYIEWLPSDQGSGNILLADGEARILNKLFTVEEAILPTVFASKLSVLLEDHIALRSFYPEIERHYQAVSTGRLTKPLSRDAIEAIQRVIHSQTPSVFDETISPAIDEAAKPVPHFDAVPLEDLPPIDPARPKPPRDPIAEADPQKSRGYIIATAINRIWSLLQKGKDAAQALEGWQKTYDLLKPHVGPVLDFLRTFLPGGDGPGGPSLPPTIGA